MRKFDLDRPVTRRDYLTMCEWSISYVMALYAIIASIYYWEEIKSWTKDRIKKIRAKLPW